MVSTDSFLAGSMKLHVLTTRTSAWSGWGVNSCPLATSWPIITSLSTRFLGHPKLTNPTFNACIPISKLVGGFFQDTIGDSPKRHHWIHLRRATRREVTGEERHG